MELRPQQAETAETAAERAERWAAESALATPSSRIAQAAPLVALQVFAGLLLVGLVGGVVLGAIQLSHRDRPGDEQLVGWINPGTCFADDPADHLPGTEGAWRLPTVDCDQAHRAEAFVGFDVALVEDGDVDRECAESWAERSEVPAEVSGIHLTTLIKTTDDSVAQQAVCVAVGAEPVEGFHLDTWQP